MVATDRIVAFLSLCGRFGTKLFSLVLFFFLPFFKLSSTKNNNNKKKRVKRELQSVSGARLEKG
jgi:hypothetical protein